MSFEQQLAKLEAAPRARVAQLLKIPFIKQLIDWFAVNTDVAQKLIKINASDTTISERVFDTIIFLHSQYGQAFLGTFSISENKFYAMLLNLASHCQTSQDAKRFTKLVDWLQQRDIELSEACLKESRASFVQSPGYQQYVYEAIVMKNVITLFEPETFTLNLGAYYQVLEVFTDNLSTIIEKTIETTALPKIDTSLFAVPQLPQGQLASLQHEILLPTTIRDFDIYESERRTPRYLAHENQSFWHQRPHLERRPSLADERGKAKKAYKFEADSPSKRMKAISVYEYESGRVLLRFHFHSFEERNEFNRTLDGEYLDVPTRSHIMTTIEDLEEKLTEIARYYPDALEIINQIQAEYDYDITAAPLTLTCGSY